MVGAPSVWSVMFVGASGAESAEMGPVQGGRVAKNDSYGFYAR